MKYFEADNKSISAIGLGTTGFWSGRNDGLRACIRTAYETYGMTLFDTAEMYGNGRCESALCDALGGLHRDTLFLVDKIHPDNAEPGVFERHLDDSLMRLGTDYIDLYLLHWRENADLPFVVNAMHEAQKAGKIRHWGVSNFTIDDLKDLFAAGGADCFCNQIFYTLYERGAEYDLVPFMKEHGILPMSYSSLGSNYHPHPDVHKNRKIMDACREYGIIPEAYMLEMNVRLGFAALFSTSSVRHLQDNLAAVSGEAYAALKPVFDREFPAPDHAVPLVKI